MLFKNTLSERGNRDLVNNESSRNKSNTLSRWPSISSLLFHKETNIQLENYEIGEALPDTSAEVKRLENIESNLRKDGGFISLIYNIWKRHHTVVRSKEIESNISQYVYIGGTPHQNTSTDTFTSFNASKVLCKSYGNYEDDTDSDNSTPLFDSSLLLVDESDTSSLENALNALKFDKDSERLTEKHEWENRLPNTLNSTATPIRKSSIARTISKRAKRFEKETEVRLINQENTLNLQRTKISENDGLSLNQLQNFKERLKEIRKENLAITLGKKTTCNGNRFSRVLNYCFLIRQSSHNSKCKTTL